MPVVAYYKPADIVPELAPAPDAEATKRLELLANIGMSQIGNLEADIRPRLELASSHFDLMTGSELTAWRGFFATAYKLKDYTFDVPPTQALEQIQLAASLKIGERTVFDRIEVWTPEQNGPVTWKHPERHAKALPQETDPMAVGMITALNGAVFYFKIARWGDTGISLADAERHVAKITRRRRQLWTLAATIALLIDAASSYGLWLAIGSVAISTILGTLITVLVALFVADIGPFGEDGTYPD